MPELSPGLLIGAGLAGFITGILLISTSTIDLTRIIGFALGLVSFPALGFGLVGILSMQDNTTSCDARDTS